MAWEGVFPEDENVALHIEAAAFRGRPVMWRYFSTFAPMESSANTAPDLTIGRIVFLVIVWTLIAGVMLGSILLARRNVRLGRGDRRGAGRFGTCLILTLMLGWLFKGDHVADPGQIIMFFDALVWAVAVGGLVWALYLAVEPIMRRHDPERMIGWSRLLDGRFDDPLVGQGPVVWLRGRCLYGGPRARSESSRARGPLPSVGPLRIVTSAISQRSSRIHLG